MKKVILKFLLFTAPLIILISFFLIFDPFRIIYKYRDYSENHYVPLNTDFVSSEVYLKNRDKYKYDSFIFGSSRTIAYKTNSWKHFLPNSANPFVFNASCESIFGIYTKIVYLDKIGTDINNCLILICPDCTFDYESDSQGHLFIKHPTIAGTSWFNFYKVFIKDYFDFGFLENYFHFLITRKYIPEMNGYIDCSKIKYDTVTNDVRLIDQDNEIKRNPNRYYKEKAKIFYDRDSIILPAKIQISKKQIAMLNEIKLIFKKHHTDYKIIISPLYSQISLNKKDLLTLQNIFGKDSVFNFSGKNSFTSKKENYFESSHYRPILGDTLMSIVYKKQ